jgi:hypothetical protein
MRSRLTEVLSQFDRDEASVAIDRKTGVLMLKIDGQDCSRRFSRCILSFKGIAA